MALVYLLTNLLNQRVYVGKTVCSLRERWAGHIRDASQVKSPRPICRALRKYGDCNFSQIVLRECSSEKEASLWEKIYISLFNSTDGVCGYNATRGGDGGTVTDPVAREKMRIAACRPRTNETRQHMSEARKKLLADETRRATLVEHCRALSRKKVGTSRVVSEETRKKLSQAMLGKKNALGTHWHSKEVA